MDERLIKEIEKDIAINKRCLQEKNLFPATVKLIEMWLNYDYKLLKLADSLYVELEDMEYHLKQAKKEMEEYREYVEEHYVWKWD